MQFQPDSLYYGDCLDVMREWPAACVDLCYLDPPFKSDADYNVLFGKEQGSDKGTFAQLTAFEDTWAWDDAAQDRVGAIERAVAHPAHSAINGLRLMLGECGMLAYLSYMAERLAEIRRVLKPEGSVYLHCDPTASHYLKALMDAIFGHDSFRNEIAWCYKSRPQPKQYFGRKHDIILFYTRSEAHLFRWHAVARDLSDSTIKKYRHVGEDGRRYRLQGRGIVGSPIRSAKDVNPQWEKDQPDLVVRDYLDKKQGTTREDWWTDINALNQNAKERLGYTTQKPIALLERIIEASSKPGDIVLDPFCGCGTTIISARNLKRRFVGIDISHFAIDLVRYRRLKDDRVPVNGIPVDMYTAKALARDKPFEFEKWAVTRVPGLVPNQRQVGDGGIDGRGMLLDGGLVLAQVKGGHFALGHLRDFRHVVSREDAACGVFTTLDAVSTRNARIEAQGAGYLKIGANRYPKTQLWSIEEYFQGRFPILPPMADPYTGKKMQLDIFAQ